MYYKSRDEAEVKDPFEDLLDLSESVMSKIERFRLVLGFGFFGGLIAGISLLTFGLLGMAYEAIDPILTGLMILGGIFSLIVFAVSIHLDGFLIHFEKRLDTLLRAKDFNPDPRIPLGRSATDRVIRYLKETDREISKELRRHPHRIRKNPILKIKEREIPFDAYFAVRRYRSASVQFFIRRFSRVVREEDLRQFKEDVELVARKKRIRPTRAIIVIESGENLEEWIYDWVENNWMVFPKGAKPGKEFHACPTEVFLERPDGFYDLAVFYVG
ncbi:MAG: hypothetical protein KAR39_00260 [Thermoplasmata archaeon]|nr:hypothetical protein [Thermoplasmata archaeon]